MASFNIHLAVGYDYLKKNKIENELDFIKGILDPDLAKDDHASHYTDKRKGTSLKDHLETKVNLNRYLKENKINNDYQKGYFLHLLTDYKFFHEFFDESYLENISYEEFCKDLYYSYVIANEWIDKKYPVKIPDEYKKRIEENIKNDLKEKECTNEKRTNILPQEKLTNWIEKMGNIDLEYQETLFK